MKTWRWLVGVAVVCLALASSAADAQEAELHAPQSDGSFDPLSNGPIPASQPVHDESAYPRFETPRELIFRNAALKAAQRRERMAINARFGYSPSRPPSSTLPFMGSPLGPPTALRGFTPYPGFAFPRPAAGFWW